MVGLWRFSFFFCRSNCLRELNSILYPLRITSCHRNVIDAEHANRTLGKSHYFRIPRENDTHPQSATIAMGTQLTISGFIEPA